MCAEELFPISHINIFLLCAMNEPNANACMFPKEKKRKMAGETKIYTYLLSTNDDDGDDDDDYDDDGEVWGARV